MALPRIINGESKNTRRYKNLKRGETFTVVETSDVSFVWQKTGHLSPDGTPLSVKLATGDVAGFVPDAQVYSLDIDISATSDV